MMPALGPRNGAATVAIRTVRPIPAAQVAIARRLRSRSTRTTAGKLQELHGERHRRQYADRDIAGAQAHRVADQEHAGGECAHGFAGQRVVEHQPEGPVR